MSRLFNTNSEAVQNAVLWQIKSTVKRSVCIFCKGMMNGPIRDLTRMPGEEEASEITCEDVDAK